MAAHPAAELLELPDPFEEMPAEARSMAKKKTIRTIPQERTPMREQDPQVRAQQLRGSRLRLLASRTRCARAERCLHVPRPAVRRAAARWASTSPASSRRSVDKDFRGAYDVITDTNLLPAVCGRVCPQESQCEGVCTVGETLEPVAIGRLERFVGDRAIAEGWTQRSLHASPTGFRIGIVGSGPAGMACAADMAKAGCEVTVYEAFHQPGGVLKYGIPDFRLPNEVIDAEIDKLRQARRQVRMQHAGRPAVHDRADDRRDGLPRGVHRHRRGLSLELHGHPRRFAERRSVGQRAAHALQSDARARVSRLRHADAARQARRGDRRRQHRDGCDARVPAARRGEGATASTAARRAECPARAEEVHHAEEEGIEFHWLTAPGRDPRRRQRQRARHALRAHGAGRARRFRAAAARCRSPAASSSSRPTWSSIAIGTNANPIIGQTSKLKLDKRGYIETDENLATSMAGVYAGGDIVTGAATVIEAMGAGRKAARSMKAYLGIRDAQRSASKRHAVRHRRA